MLLKATVAALAFSSLAVSSPVDLLDKRRHRFSVHQVARGHRLRNGPQQMLRTYRKFNAAPPQELLTAADAVNVSSAATDVGGQTGSDPANPEIYDQEYLSPVSIGSNGQTLNLDFDTGSADLWVYSTNQPSSQQTGHEVYNPSTSSSSQSLDGYTWRISYGDGSGASGSVYADKVVVGGVTATSQAVEAATSVSAQFVGDTANDGLLGLAFSRINTVRPRQQTIFFDTVKSSLASPLFTATLKRRQPGTYDFGYIDSSKYTGNIAYTPVNTAHGFWEFTSDGYAVGSGGIVSTSIDGIADTGTTLLYLPPSVVTDYYSQVSGARYSSNQGGYTFPCSAQLPNFSAVIGGVLRTTPGSFINYAPVSSTRCFGGIQRNDGIGFSIFGDIFLKSQFVVFDSNGPRLGFAQQAGVAV